MKIVCGNCGRDNFNCIEECLDHEKVCGKTNTFICSKCGKVVMWKNTDIDAQNKMKKCHYINLGRMDYSNGKLDGCDVNFYLCNSCLIGIIDTFEFKDDIYNSGSNFYDTELRAAFDKIDKIPAEDEKI
jgi:hypothetical protein